MIFDSLRKPLIKRGYHNGTYGEYSTAQVSESVIETMFLPNDGSDATLIGRTVIPSMATIMADHCAAYDA